jgi:hypothetical protein
VFVVDVRSGLEANFPSDSESGLGEIKVEVALEDRGDTADWSFCSDSIERSSFFSCLISDVSPASSATPFSSSIPSFVSSSKESSSGGSESGVDCREASSSALSSTGVDSSTGGLGEADSGGGVNDELLLPGVSVRGDDAADE